MENSHKDITCRTCKFTNPTGAGYCMQCGSLLANQNLIGEQADFPIDFDRSTLVTDGKSISCPICNEPNYEVAVHCIHCGNRIFKYTEDYRDLLILKEYFEARFIKVYRKIPASKLFSNLYLSEDPEKGYIIIDFLKADFIENNNARSQFQKGYQINSKVSHPNILKVYELNHISDRDYAITDYAERGTLSWVLKTYGNYGMPIELALNYVQKILTCLQAIHEQGIIHRDLTSDSVLINKDNSIYITNFHYATDIILGEEIIERESFGTLEYMSPERCKLGSPIDIKSDIYSVGIIFYELLTGEMPFMGDKYTIQFKQINEEIPSIEDKLLAKELNSFIRNKDILYISTDPIARILDKATSKSKSGRYDSATEFAEDIENLQELLKSFSIERANYNKWNILKGYRAEHVVHEEDKLGITSTVNSFAHLFVSKSVQPPLAIGLFGPWGSGKSFFIDKLSEKIESITQNSAREIKEGKKENELLFYSKVVQIRFNSWHYIEGNLWASLVQNIFSNLKLKGEQVDEIKERRKFLIEQIEKEKKGINDLENELSQFNIKMSEIENKIEKQNENHVSKMKSIFENKYKDELRQKFTPSEVKRLYKKANLPYNPQEPLSEQISKLYKTGDGKTGISKWTLFARKFSFLIIAFYVLLVFAGIGTFGYYIYQYFLKGTWFANWIASTFQMLKTNTIALIGSISALIAPALGLYKILGPMVDKALNWNKDFNDKMRGSSPELAKDMATQEKTLEQKLLDLENEKKKIEEKKKIAETYIQNMNNELEKATYGDDLSNFIQNRMGSDDYKKHLGVITQIRDDFHRLSNLLMNYNKSIESEEYLPKETDDFMFNRIVLYFDDLDRLKSEKVVEILQAIHLLLAFPAFIVIVAVDSKYVYQSLMTTNKDLFSREARLDSSENNIPVATPQDYLERIFQIPVWLYPMNIEGRRNLLEELFKDTLKETHKKEVNKKEEHIKIFSDDEDFDEMSTQIEYKKSKIKQLSELNISPNKVIQMSDIQENFLYITLDEKEFSIKIAPILGQSPRSLKRFVNVYLLTKASLTELQAKIFFTRVHPKTGRRDTEGTIFNYEAAMFLLAVVTGLPATSQLFFRTLRSNSLKKLSDLFDSMDIKKVQDKWYILGDSAQDLSLGLNPSNGVNQKKDWDINTYYMKLELLQFTRWLDREKRNWYIADLDQIRYWEPIVSRFSFRVEPIEQE